MRSRLEKNSSVQQYNERKFAPKTTVTNTDVLSYYGNHLDVFKQPQQGLISHILIQSDPTREVVRNQEARRRAQQILSELKKSQDFSTLERERFDGPTRTNGGDLGYIKMCQIEKPLESAVFSPKSGETRELVETDYGSHIFRVVDRKQETILAYDSVKERIKQYLVQEKAKQAADKQAKTLLVAISQSGETADTLAALREATGHGAPTIAICNVLDSSIARAADNVLYTLAEPEIGVASTKAFVTQLVALHLLDGHVAQLWWSREKRWSMPLCICQPSWRRFSGSTNRLKNLPTVINMPAISCILGVA